MKKTTEIVESVDKEFGQLTTAFGVDAKPRLKQFIENLLTQRDAEWLKEVEGLVPPEERPRMGSENKEKSMDGPSMLLGYLLGLILGVLLSILASTVNK